jgi:hypothetical protein
MATKTRRDDAYTAMLAAKSEENAKFLAEQAAERSPERLAEWLDRAAKLTVEFETAQPSTTEAENVRRCDEFEVRFFEVHAVLTQDGGWGSYAAEQLAEGGQLKLHGALYAMAGRFFPGV